jgi:outer membrane immunogenic protein
MKRFTLAGFALVTLASTISAQAADMPLKAVKAPPPSIELWTGFYIGGNGGYSWGSASESLTATSQTTGTITQTTLGGAVLNTATAVGPLTTIGFGSRARMDGWVGGGQAGYNYRIDNWLLGIEADIQGTGQQGGTTYCLTANCLPGTLFVTSDHHLEWFATVRGRVGILLDNRKLLLYGTGGYAVGQIDSNYALGQFGAAGPLAVAGISSTRSGWTAGGGGEYHIDPNWSVKLEYLYLDLGRNGVNVATTQNAAPVVVNFADTRLILNSSTVTTGAINTRFTDHILRAGVNYRF